MSNPVMALEFRVQSPLRQAASATSNGLPLNLGYVTPLPLPRVTINAILGRIYPSRDL